MSPFSVSPKENALGPPLVAPFTSDKSALERHRAQLKEKLTQIFEQTKVEVTKSLSDHGFPAPTSVAWESLKGQMLSLDTSTDHPIMRIVFKR